MSANDITPEEKERAWMRLQEEWRTGQRKIEYPNVLRLPIFCDPEAWGDDSANGNVAKVLTRKQHDYRASIDKKAGQKWDWLFWLYGIETSKFNKAEAWEALARALVCQHVPGFALTASFEESIGSTQKIKRRPKKWTRRRMMELVTAVSAILEEIARKNKKPTKKVSPLAAVKILIERDGKNWAPERRNHTPAQRAHSLRNRYNDAVREMNKPSLANLPIVLPTEYSK